MASPSRNRRPDVVPYLLVDRVDDLVDFARAVFHAELRGRLTRPDGTVMHVELAIGDGLLMAGEPMGEFGPTPGWLFVTVADCDRTYSRALEAGATSVMEVTDMHHAGERYGGVKDPFGNVWWISTTVDEVDWKEQQRRIDALVEQELGE